MNVTDDAVFEDTETFTVDLSGASNATISDAQGVGTILDNDVQDFPGGLAYTVAGKGSTGAFLYSIDLESGIATELGPVVVGNEAKAVFTGLAMNPESDTLFGLAGQGNKTWIVEINPVNGEVIDFFDVSSVLSNTRDAGATFDSDGQYYVLQDDVVYRFNQSNGNLTTMFTIAGGLVIDGFAIDPVTGDMFFAVNNGSATDLYKLDSADIPASNVPVNLELIGTVNGILPDGTNGDAAVDSLSFDNYGNLWGADNSGDLLKIDPESADIEGTVTLANNEVTGAGVFSLGIATTEDQVFEGGNGDDILTGGSGSDILTGGLGDDVFVWTANDDIDIDPEGGDGIARDVVTDFRQNGDLDTLDLKDLLQGESYGLDGDDSVTSGNILDFITVSENGDGDVVLTISSDGESAAKQEITLQGTTLVDLGATSGNDIATPEGQADIIGALIANGSIQVDQS